MTVLLFVIWAVFSGIRIYAISGGSWWLACIIFALNMVPAAVNAYNFFGATWYYVGNYPPDNNLQCLSGDDLTFSVYNKFALATRISVIVADVTILLAVWLKTYAMKRFAHRHKIQTPVAAMLMRDGTAYFLVLLALNIFAIAGDIAQASPATNGEMCIQIFSFTVTTFTPALSSIIITHVLHNLRQAARHAQDGFQSSWPHSQQSSLRFASAIGNFREELAYGSDRAPDSDMIWLEDGGEHEVGMGVQAFAPC